MSVYNDRGWNASETPLFSGDRERVIFGKKAGFETRAGGMRRVAGMRAGHEGRLVSIVRSYFSFEVGLCVHCKTAFTDKE